MPTDAYAYYWYSPYATGATATSTVSLVDLLVAFLWPVVVLAAFVGFEIWMERVHQRPRVTLNRRERHALADLERALEYDDPALARMLHTMSLDQGVRP